MPTQFGRDGFFSQSKNDQRNEELRNKYQMAKDIYEAYANGYQPRNTEIQLLYDMGFKVGLPAGAPENRVMSDCVAGKKATWKRDYYKQIFREVESKSVNLKLNTDLLLSDELFGELVDVLSVRLPRVRRDLDPQRLGSFAAVFDYRSIQPGKHLIEYLSAPDQYPPCFSYNATFSMLNPVLVGAIQRLVQTKIRNSGSMLNGRTLNFDSVGLSYVPPQRADEDAHINLEIKFFIASAPGVDSKADFHTGSHYKRGVVVNIHLQSCPREFAANAIHSMEQFSKRIADRINDFGECFFCKHYLALENVGSLVYRADYSALLYQHRGIDVEYKCHDVKFNRPPPYAPQAAVDLGEEEFPSLSSLRS